MSSSPGSGGSGRPTRGPPALAESLLEWALPDGLVGQTIVGDLRQEYHERAAETPKGLAVWFWAQSLRLAGHYVALRVTGRWPRYGQARGWRAEAAGGAVAKPREEIMATLMADLRYGLRMLVRTPMLSLFAVATIALGVGLTSHTFSSVYGTVLRGLTIPTADRLMMVSEAIPSRNVDQTSLPIRDYLDFRDQTTSFEFLAGFYQGTVNLAGDAGPPERYAGGFMSANAFDGLGVPPILGRTFRDGEDAPGASPVVILGYDVWKTRFASDPDIVGSTIRANGEATTVIGVMPDGFRFPFDEDLWVTHRLDPDESEARREGWSLNVYGVLSQGVTLEAANAELAAIATRIAELESENEGVTASAIPLTDWFMPRQITAVMFLMLAATFGVLLIACANVANLLLARATSRGREVAIRTAMGASRSRVIRQLLAEALILGLAGGVLGLVLSYVGLGVFNNAIVDIEKPYWIDIRLDGPSLLFTLVVTLGAAVVAGTLPAVRASGGGVGAILRDESRGSSSLRLGRFSTVLVVGELAVSCGLLIGAGLMVKSVINLKTLDLGFETEGLLTARIGLFESDYPTQEAVDQFFQSLLERVEAEPDVISAALTTSPPGTGTGTWRISIEGETYESRSDRPRVNGTFVGAGFFDTYGVQVRSGRDLRWAESWSGSEPVAVVDESFAVRHLAGSEALGRRFKLGAPDSDNPWVRIVGVVPDLHVGGGVGGIGSDQLPDESVYVSTGTFELRFLTLAVKTRGQPQAFAATARRIAADLDPNLPLYRVMTQERALDDATWAFGIFGSLFTIFGVVALFLASVGLYGVMAFSVARRRQEMGVRMALGADAPAIIRLVLQKGVVQLIIGLGIGLAIGAAMGIPLRAVTYGVEAWDTSVATAIIGTLAMTGLAATLVPAIRATRVDPNTALRPE